MAASNLTSLSIGLLVRDLLMGDPLVRSVCGKVFPVVSEAGAVLPYLCYRRGATLSTQAKGARPADSATVEVMCYASSYAGSVAMAEAVRSVLDGVQATYTAPDGARLVARSIVFDDSQESWSDDAYIQTLVFIVRV